MPLCSPRPAGCARAAGMFKRYELTREFGNITIRAFTETETVFGFIFPSDVEYVQNDSEFPPLDGYQFVQHNIGEILAIFWEKLQSFDIVDFEHLGNLYKSVDITLLDLIAAKPRLSHPGAAG
jgi:hypothetical protein